jgi:beta-glucosidase/6-phospho-beta-glucosidase/beta-galactosidase
MWGWTRTGFPSRGRGFCQVSEQKLQLSVFSMSSELQSRNDALICVALVASDGTGQVNQAGIDHYNKLIDSLLSKGENRLSKAEEKCCAS